MTWGPMYMYYHCPKCGLKFEYAVDMIPDFGEKFGYCPKCDVMGVYEKDGARQPDDADYLEVEYMSVGCSEHDERTSELF